MPCCGIDARGRSKELTIDGVDAHRGKFAAQRTYHDSATLRREAAYVAILATACGVIDGGSDIISAMLVSSNLYGMVGWGIGACFGVENIEWGVEISICLQLHSHHLIFLAITPKGNIPILGNTLSAAA